MAKIGRTVEFNCSLTGSTKINYLISCLLLAVLFISRIHPLTMLAVLISFTIALSILIKATTKPAISKHLFSLHLILVGGTALFYIIFGPEQFLTRVASNLLLILPAATVSLFFLLQSRFVKTGLHRIITTALALLLVLFSLQYFFTMNLRIRPQVDSLRAGHDDYLLSLKGDPSGPNVLLILLDDLGYGDLSVYGNDTINTPSINMLAERGVVMDNFYAASPVCTPSRFAVLTGRYPARGHLDEVLMPSVKSFNPLNPLRHWNALFLEKGVEGILPDEITIAKALQGSGYATAIFGKWHLGDYGDYLPVNHGFDYFYGSYYSNDMHPYEFYRNDEKVVEHPLDQTRITRLLTDEIVGFIADNKDNPFFIYYPTPWPHDPLFASEEFTDTSLAGTYGDCMQEFDAGLGEILQVLMDYSLFEDTLIIFTSDNGPWHEGSAGGLRGRKGNTLEGGQKVPFIAHYPGALPEGARVESPAMNIDLFPTILKLCGLELPSDRIIDGIDIWPLLLGEEGAAQHEALFYSRGGKVFAVQSGGFKYFEKVRSENTSYLNATYKNFLFDLENDPSESYNVLNRYPETAEALNKKLQDFRRRMKENPRGKL